MRLWCGDAVVGAGCGAAGAIAPVGQTERCRCGREHVRGMIWIAGARSAHQGSKTGMPLGLRDTQYVTCSFPGGNSVFVHFFISAGIHWDEG